MEKTSQKPLMFVIGGSFQKKTSSVNELEVILNT
jgi:hypothetical protein